MVHIRDKGYGKLKNKKSKLRKLIFIEISSSILTFDLSVLIFSLMVATPSAIL